MHILRGVGSKLANLCGWPLALTPALPRWGREKGYFGAGMRHMHQTSNPRPPYSPSLRFGDLRP